MLFRSVSANGWRTCVVGKGHFHGGKQDLERSRDYVYRGYDERLYGDLLGTGHQSYPYRGANSELEGAGSGHGYHASGGTFTLAGPSDIPEFQESEHQVTAEAVRFVPYILATWIGTFPGTVMYVYLGVVGKAAHHPFAATP